MAERRRLGELLLNSRLITPEQLEKALKVQEESGERLGKILVKLGYVTEDDILALLEFQLGVPRVSLEDYEANPSLLELFPEHLLKQHKAFPIARRGNRLLVAVADPLNVVAIDDLRLAAGCEIDPVIARESEIESALEKNIKPRARPVVTTGLGGPGEAPAVELVDRIIEKAVRLRASDVHIEPQADMVRIRCRIDGFLREVLRLPLSVHSSLVSRVKIMAEMNIAEKRVPQDGRVQVKVLDHDVDLRVSSIPTIYGEKLVLRILDKSSLLLDLEELGFEPEALSRYRYLFNRAYGMILLTGPTGSGKTTTLYATLRELNTEDRNIVTIEDPVEYVLPGINQTGINPKAGLTFASGLRSFLRQDPDVIMVGEIRDSETADIAIRAATAGHLVLSTLHTGDAVGAVTRLLEMGVEPYLLASALTGVVAQRLVRRICPHCRESYLPEQGGSEALFLSYSGRSIETLYRGKGCQRCDGSGYGGRVAIQEVMLVGPRIRELILEKAPSDRLRAVAVSEGMVSLKEDGIGKALKGVTTLAEIMRVTLSLED